MLCLEEPGCSCSVCDRKEMEYRMRKLKLQQTQKQKKEEDDFIQECIQNNNKPRGKKLNSSRKLIKTIYVSVYKHTILPIEVDYVDKMKSYNLNPNLKQVATDSNYYTSIFSRLDMLQSQFSNKRVKKDKYNMILPYSLCFHLKDKAEQYISEWCITLTYLHTYGVLSENDGIFKADLYSDLTYSLTRI